MGKKVKGNERYKLIHQSWAVTCRTQPVSPQLCTGTDVTGLLVVITLYGMQNVKSLCCTLETNTILCMNYTSVKKSFIF